MNDEELLLYLFYKQLIYSFNELYKKAKEAHPNIKKPFVKEWFDKQQSIQMTNKPVGKKEFLPIYSETPYAFQLDLTFFPRYKKQNKGYTVLFTAININSRFVYAYYSKDKEMKTILEFLKIMESKTIINSITCDEGSEFKNIEFKKFCLDNNITLFFVKSDGHKLGIINRMHRTLKDKLTTHFSANDTVIWYDVIDKIIYNYNHSVNRGIGIEPYKVNSFIENEIIQKKKDETKEITSKVDVINIGDKCRILLERNTFQDKMTPKYSNKVYDIVKISKNSVYVIDNNYLVKVKKSNIKIVKHVEAALELKERKNVNVYHRVDRMIVKSGVESSNIIEGKRERKRNTKYDL
jgi:hypothetical protein